MVASLVDVVVTLVLMARYQRVLVGHGGCGRDFGAHGAVSTCPCRTLFRRWRSWLRPCRLSLRLLVGHGCVLGGHGRVRSCIWRSW